MVNIMEQKTIEFLQDFESNIENTITVIHEEKKHNPNTVLITYILQHLSAVQVLIQSLLEIEAKK